MDIQLSGNNIIAISGHPVAGSGGGTQSDFVYYPVFDDTTGNVEFHLGTTASNPQPAGGWHISGATGPQGIQGEQGIQGIQGIPGVDGKNPVFEINSSDAHWRWKYAEATSGWTDLGVVASGAVGPKGQDGTNGVTPGVRINTTTNKWEIAADGTTWVPTDVNATGPQGAKGDKGDTGATGSQGEKGDKGDKGDNGVSPTVSTDPTTGGTIVTFTYGTGQSESITVLNGTPGAAGASGYSPTVSTEAVTAEGHPQGGTKVTITDLEHQSGQEFYVWNGTNGQGATVNLLDGDGIHITNDGTNYTIGVSANYSAMAVTWVQDQQYLTDIPNTYALKTDVEAASANAYNEAVAQIPNVDNFITKDVNNLTYYYKKTETSSTSEITNALSTKLDSTVAAQTYQPKGNYASASDITDMATKTWVGDQGFLKNTDLTNYATKTYANEASANALSQAESWVETEGYLKAVPAGYATETYANNASANAYNEAVARIPTDYITKDVNDLTYYYKTSETSSTSEITNALSTKLDSTVAAQTYQTKADMTNYLTTSDASTTYQPKGNYATTSDISDMATQTWVGQQGYLTSIPNTYALKTDVEAASANALSQAKTWVNQQNFATSAGLAANTRYEMTNTGWTSAIKIQVDSQAPTVDDGILHIILES